MTGGDPEGIRSVEYFFTILCFEFNLVLLINFSLFLYIYILILQFILDQFITALSVIAFNIIRMMGGCP